MKSLYLEERIQQLTNICESEIVQAERQFSGDEYNLLNQKKGKPNLKPFFWTPMGIGIGLGILFISGMGFLGALLLGVILGIVAGIAAVILKTVMTKKYNEGIDQAILHRKAILDQGIADRKKRLQYDIDNETASYENAVNAAKQKYGGSLTIGPLVEFMTTIFKSLIQGANRGSYNANIFADMKYTVETNGVTILFPMPHSGIERRETFDFFKNNVLPIDQFYNRVGCAQALSKQIEFQIKKDFPVDPIAPMENESPQVFVLDQNDETVVLRYLVRNPDYKPAQAL